MKLIIIPLAFLAIFSLLSLMGLGTGTLNSTGTIGSNGWISSGGDPDVAWWDSTGFPVAYQNFTVVDRTSEGRIIYVGAVPLYKNTTSEYQIYRNTVASNQLDETTAEWDITSSLGLIGVVVGVMALATFAGVSVLGSGISETSVSAIVKGTAYLLIWGVFSALAIALIMQIALFGPILYFILTLIYTLGIVNSIGSSQGDI